MKTLVRKTKNYISDLIWDMRIHPRVWLSRLVFLLCPLFSYVMAEILNNNNPFTSLELWRAAWNIVWYTALLLFFWLVSSCRRCLGCCLAAVFSWGFALVNHYVLRFRGTALFPIDILSWRTAANVADAYDFTPDGRMWISLGILAVYILCAVLTRDKKPRRVTWHLSAPVAAVLAGFLLCYFCTGMLPHFGIYAEQWLTQKNGFIFNFMTALRYSFATEPEDYELEEIEQFKLEFMAELEQEPAQPEPETEPVNIIIIMNESWADLSVYENYSANADTMNNIDALEENTVSGYLLAPVAGGGTANVEYEVLTGNPYIFLPGGTVAYQLFIDTDSPSLAEISEADSSFAFHPYLASGWNRTQAYEYLGFDEQLFDEDVADPEYVRNYISDECSFDVITDITEAESGETFIFNVTMQNHSGYDQGWNNLDRDVHLTGDLTGESNAAEQYLNLADMTDEAFAELIEYYESCSEPTIIAMFGDHQPPLSDEFFEKLLGKPESELSDEERMVEFLVPFVVWANYDIPEDDDVFLSCNYFGLLVSDLAGVERTPYMEFIADVAEALPVIHKLGFVDDEGEFIDSRSQLDPEEAQLLDTYEMLAYNYLFDREQGDGFFEGTD